MLHHFVSYLRDLFKPSPIITIHRSGLPLAEVTDVFRLSFDSLFCTVACPYCGYTHSHSLQSHDLRCRDAGPRLSHCRLTAMRFGEPTGGEYRVVLNRWHAAGAVVQNREVFTGPVDCYSV